MAAIVHDFGTIVQLDYYLESNLLKHLNQNYYEKDLFYFKYCSF
jgi:hypothetical protein